MVSVINMTNQNSQDCYDLSVQESVLRIEYEISGCPWYHSELFIWNFCAGTKKSCQNGKNKFEEKKTICYKSHPCRPIFQFHFNRISHSHIYIWKVSTNCLNQWQAQLPKYKNVRFETDHCETEFEFISMLGKWHLKFASIANQIRLPWMYRVPIRLLNRRPQPQFCRVECRSNVHTIYIQNRGLKRKKRRKKWQTTKRQQQSSTQNLFSFKLQLYTL